MPTVLLPVPHYKQIAPHNCLPACARMVLTYLEQPVTEAALATKLEATVLGTPGNRLLRLNSPTLLVEFGPLTLPLIYNYIDNGAPIIALVRTGFLDYYHVDMAHAVVVVGYDDQYLLLNDPDFDIAPQQATRNGFLAAWGEFDFLAATIKIRV
ncbi:MAG: C39 family peptidase [Anaerolineae bacterium]|nr:C39 family peptidase [Anaerolineae bacterium]